MKWQKTGNAMIIPEGTFSQNKMKYLITSLIVYQIIFYTCETQNEKHFTKMQRKLVLYQFKTTVLSSTKETASSPFFPSTPICSSGRNSSRTLMINNSLAGGSRETLNGIWSQVNLKCTSIEYWSCFIGRRGISFKKLGRHEVFRSWWLVETWIYCNTSKNWNSKLKIDLS